MTNTAKIYHSLLENAEDEQLAEFLAEIFREEYDGLHKWRDLYGDLIDKYSEGYK